MANTKKYVSFDKLSVYDELLKAKIAADDKATLDSAKAYADGLAVNYDATGSAATVQGKLDEEIARAKAAEEVNAAAAAAAQSTANEVKTYVGTIPSTATATDIVGYVQEKTSGIATDTALSELTGRVAQAETDIDNIEKDYLKATDKTELSDAITAEAARADAAEKVNAGKIAAIEADYLKATDKTELQGNIDTVSSGLAAVKEDVDAFFAAADMSENAKDTLKELQEYIASDETGAAAMAASIKQNTDAITAEAGKVATLQTEMDAVEQKATDNASAISVLQAAIADGGSVDVRIDALEAAVGESGSVAGDIEEAKDAAITAAAEDATTKANQALADAKSYTDTEIETVEVTIATLTETVGTKAAQADLTALTNRVAANETNIGTLQSEMDAVEALAAANKLAHEANTAAIALKASQADLEAVSGRVTTLEDWHKSFAEVSEEEINSLFTVTA